jgi:beta-lactamase regulating signal transducer with metallopeptidase domain
MTAGLLVGLAVRGAVLFAAAWLAAAALRRGAATTRHVVWTLAVAGVLATPALQMALPAWRVLPDFRFQEVVRSADARRHTSPVPPSATVARPPNAAQPSPVAQPFRAAANLGIAVAQRLSAPIVILWASVALLLLARVAYGVLAIRRIARHARPADSRWRERLARILHDTGTTARIRLLVSRDIAMPMTWGSRQPLLLLPAGAATWPDERADVVLLHELAHIRRADWITHALARVAAAVHWFDPLAWCALRAMTRERERACDDFVLAHGARASDYARHLLDIAAADASGAAFAIAPAMARPSELEGRLLSILAPRRPRARRAVRPAVALAAAAATGFVAAAAPPAVPAQATPAGAITEAERPARRPSAALPGDSFKPGPATETPEVAALARALEDPSASVRESAAMGLALRSGDGVVDPLLRALNDADSQVREKAAIGLAMRPQARVVEALLAAMEDPDAQVREKVVIALGLSGDGRARTALVKAMDDPDEQVREKAVKALATFAVSDAVRDGIVGALKSLRADVR